MAPAAPTGAAKKAAKGGDGSDPAPTSSPVEGSAGTPAPASDATSKKAKTSEPPVESSGSLDISSDDVVPAEKKPTRAATMDDLAEASAHELTIVGAKTRYSLNLFGDTNFGVRFGNGVEKNAGFGIGVLDLLFNATLEKHFKALAEFGLEYGTDGGLGVDLERLALEGSVGPLTIAAGRWHTEFGYWNAAYHHGGWLQPSIDRPRWVRFEDQEGILPVHMVGLDATLQGKIHGVTVRANAAVGNGRGKIVDDVTSAFDPDFEKAVFTKLEVGNLFVRDFRFGVAGFYSGIAKQPASVRPALPGVHMDEFIGNFYVGYTGAPWFLLAESYAVAHLSKARQSYLVGGFVHVGYQIGIVQPYVRLERLSPLGKPDGFFVPDPAEKGASYHDNLEMLGGARIDLTNWCAVKTEYVFGRSLPSARDSHEIRASWSFGI